ncbi:MAG: hypothetical protein ACI381_02280 [Candidatus Methanomethylophilaceae archaeon]
MPEVPVTLGICRDCSKMQILTARTLDDKSASTVYYCRATRHRTYGCAQCRMFMSRGS